MSCIGAAIWWSATEAKRFRKLFTPGETRSATPQGGRSAQSPYARDGLSSSTDISRRISLNPPLLTIHTFLRPH